MIGSAAIMGCAAASAPLFLSSAGSESLRLQLAGQCPDAAFPVLQQIGFQPVPADVDETAPAALIGQGLAAPARLVTVNSQSAIQADGGSARAQVLFRDGALDEVTVLERVAGDGLLLPQTTAQSLGVAVGDRVQVGGDNGEGGGAVLFPVVGIYRDLFLEDGVRPFWCSYTALFLNEASGSAPAPLVLTTSPDVVERAGEAESVFYGMVREWTSPIDTDGLTLSEATTIVQARERAFAASEIANDTGGEGETGQLPKVAERARLLVDGLRGPVLPVAVGGAVLALLLVAAAGSYWADRRAAEIRLLSSRGVGPTALGVKALLELALPAAVGAVLGWWAARELVTRVGPSPYLDAAAPGQAAVAAAASLVVSLVLLTLVAAARCRAAVETPAGGRRRWYAALPWELLLVAVAVALYLRLRGQDPVRLVGNVAQVDLWLVAVPLLFLAAACIAAARGIIALLRPLRARSRRWSVALFTGIARAVAARPVSALMLVAVALPISVLTYSAGLTTTNEVTLEAKARVVVGSDRAVISVDQIQPTPALDDVGTVVVRYDRALAGDQDLTVLAVEPGTFARWAFWDIRFADLPLDELLRRLQRASGDRISALAVGLPLGPVNLDLGTTEVPAAVVAAPATFPGRRSPDPLVIVDVAALGEVDGSAGRVSEVWTTRSADQVRTALPEGVRTSRVFDRDTVFDVANFRSVTWTFGYLQALAALIGVIGAGGLLLYLETRQRARIAAYAMARRMGMTGGTHLRSLLVELGGLLGAALLVGAAAGWAVVLVIYRLVDIDPNRPPGPLLTTPTAALLAAATATVLAGALAALYAHLAATRASTAQVLRLSS